MIPPGLKSGETEYLEFESRMIAIHEGRRTEIHDLPMHTLKLTDMAIDDKQRNCLMDLGLYGFYEQIIQFLKCNASSYDFTPDLKDGKFQNEYCKCAFRGKCAFEGKLCKPIKLESGEHLTMSELRITSQVRAGFFDKEIADQMGISENTLRVHQQNIREKLKIARKPHLVSKAIEMGIA